MDAHVGTIASAALGAAVMYVVLRRSAKPTLPHGITVYYHSACKAFTGRADAIVRMLEQAGCEYSVKAPSDAPASYTSDEACFAVPIVAFPNGIVMSQSIAIAQQLGKALGLYPATVAGEARAIQVALNVGDLLSEGGKKLKEDKPRLTKCAAARRLAQRPAPRASSDRPCRAPAGGFRSSRARSERAAAASWWARRSLLLTLHAIRS